MPDRGGQSGHAPDWPTRTTARTAVARATEYGGAGGAATGGGMSAHHHGATGVATRGYNDNNSGGREMFELIEKLAPNAVIKVIGVGGGGGNAVAHMINANIEGVEFVVANTDAQAMTSCNSRTHLQLGSNVTKGLGAGANPEVGRQAALEDRERIE